jgi:hypothetical protein
LKATARGGEEHRLKAWPGRRGFAEQGDRVGRGFAEEEASPTKSYRGLGDRVGRVLRVLRVDRVASVLRVLRVDRVARVLRVLSLERLEGWESLESLEG